MTVDQACLMPKGTIVEHYLGGPWLNALGEAGFFPIRQNGHWITLQRMTDRLERFC